MAEVCPDPWPWSDDRIDRYRRVAHMYRDRLADEAPAACAEIDFAMRSFGQDWIVGGYVSDPEELFTTTRLAELADVSEAAVRQWVKRWPLRRMGTDRDGRALYRWGDVIEHHAESKRKKQSAK
ncbi:hypothetical protein [Mycolicibacterium sp.]|uniref:hypothetical protein n=1 Tax=Mycolicibacterium sp. TaxID=2320850 RepID=UPI001A2E6162|nr:hypothetical protein [Mycolicibacterium sp.]MBJ7340639.1 hypothetical protein [Mycolicibacterium sp.]